MNILIVAAFALCFGVRAETQLDLQVYNYTGSSATLQGIKPECMKKYLGSEERVLNSEVTDLSLTASNWGSCYHHWSSQTLLFKNDGKSLASITIKILPGKLGKGYSLRFDDNQIIDPRYRLYSYPDSHEISSWSKMTVRVALYKE